jgi:WD repeat-containing protein mio
MSGTLAALTTASAKTPELRHQYERLIMRLEDPYFRAMLTYLALGDWADVLEEEYIPLRERLAIALQFLEDDALSAYLRRIAEASASQGDVEGIIVTGLTASGMQLLQNYTDRTGDVQTAAILGAYVHPHQLKDARVDRWLDAYRDLLDGWKFFHHRCQLDMDRGQMLQDFTQDAEREPIRLVPPQILIRCNYCNKVISEPRAISAANRVSAGRHSLDMSGLLMLLRMQATACPFCHRPLPRCSVCLMTLGIIPDSARNGQLAHYNAPMRGACILTMTKSCRSAY